MAYILVEKKRFARVWNLQPSERWPLRKWILKRRDERKLDGWPCFWLLWRVELSIDSDVYSDGKRVNGWSLICIIPWAMATITWKHPHPWEMCVRQTSAEVGWNHHKGWRYEEGAMYFKVFKSKVWRRWSWFNRLTQVKLTDIKADNQSV